MHGKIKADGNTAPGGKVILAAAHASVTGSISARSGSCPNLEVRKAKASPFSVLYYEQQATPGKISIQFETGEVQGKFDPALSRATIRFNRETNKLQNC